MSMTLSPVLPSGFIGTRSNTWTPERCQNPGMCFVTGQCLPLSHLSTHTPGSPNIPQGGFFSKFHFLSDFQERNPCECWGGLAGCLESDGRRPTGRQCPGTCRNQSSHDGPMGPKRGQAIRQSPQLCLEGSKRAHLGLLGSALTSLNFSCPPPPPRCSRFPERRHSAETRSHREPASHLSLAGSIWSPQNWGPGSVPRWNPLRSSHTSRLLGGGGTTKPSSSSGSVLSTSPLLESSSLTRAVWATSSLIQGPCKQ